MQINAAYQPAISILVPVHNEEKNIEKKLSNIKEVLYPKDKMEIIIANDASEDTTREKANAFIKDNPDRSIRTVDQTVRGGKAAALNAALSYASNSIVVVSDADTLWPADILEKALPYLSDSSVGAITGMGLNRNDRDSWVTKTEDSYLQFMSLVRLGESKIASTIRFEGGFCAYKKAAFEQFDCESGSDDSGTALDVVHHNYRTIFVPEAVFYTSFSTDLLGKLKTKGRRANQLIGLWIKCFKLLMKKRLVLPKRIVLPEIFLFMINPIIFLLLACSTIAYVAIYPLSLFSLVLLMLIASLLISARNLFLELILDNLLLVYASLSFLLGRRYLAWKKT